MAAKQQQQAKVVAPLVAVRDENGYIQYLYRGAVLPEYVEGDQRKHLEELGMVAPGADDEVIAGVGVEPDESPREAVARGRKGDVPRNSAELDHERAGRGDK